MLVCWQKSIGHKRRQLVFLFSVFCFISFSSFFFFIKSVALRSVFFDMHAAPTVTRSQLTAVCGLFFFVSLLFFGDVAFSEHHVPLPFICMESAWYVFLTDGVIFCFVFSLATTTWIWTSAYYLRFESINQSINQSINLLPPTSGDKNARGGGMSSSYVVKYTMNVDSQRPLRCKTHRPQSTVT